MRDIDEVYISSNSKDEGQARGNTHDTKAIQNKEEDSRVLNQADAKLCCLVNILWFKAINIIIMTAQQATRVKWQPKKKGKKYEWGSTMFLLFFGGGGKGGIRLNN